MATLLRKHKKQEDFKDLGYSAQATSRNQRLMNKDGSSNVVRTGMPFLPLYDIYNTLLTMPWIHFFILVVGIYFFTNLIFALIYLGIGVEFLGGISSTDTSGHFWDAFFFSAQTLSTVGYGHISPRGFSTSLAASLEALLGLLGFALITGLLYGRFSRPTAKLLFSKNILVAPYRDMKALMFRLVNIRVNQLIDCEVQFLFSRNEMDDGKNIRKFYILDLERQKVSTLALSWTVVHPIDEKSPFYNIDPEELKNSEVEFIIMFKAYDDTFAQTVHSRSSYRYEEIIWNAKFKPMFGNTGEDGVTEIHLDHIDEIEVLA